MIYEIVLTIFSIFFVFLMFLYILKSFNRFKNATTIKKRYGIPDGDIKYTDLDKPAKALFSKQYNLTGKPDYIVKRKEGYIPVEVKTSNTDDPYKSHIMQLAAYCLLVEGLHNTKVPYGIVVYGKKQFKIPYNYTLKTSLMKTIGEIRDCLRTSTITRNHGSINKCNNCCFRADCNDFVLN